MAQLKKPKTKKFPSFTSEITKLQIIAKPFSLMHGKLETDHKTHAFIFHTSHHKSPKKKKKLQNLSIIKPKTIQPNPITEII